MILSLKPKVISFRDREYNIQLLEIAVAKAITTHIEPNSEFDEIRFDQSLFPKSWSEKIKKPVITMYQGKYVVVYLPEHHQDLDLKDGFKALFITKYSLGQAKVVAVEEVAEEPIQDPPVRSYQRREYSHDSRNKERTGFANKYRRRT